MTTQTRIRRHAIRPAFAMVFVASLLAGCSGFGDDVAASADPAAGNDASGSAGPGSGPFSLTVKDGYGSGSYQAGDTVHVAARVNPYNSVVTGWQSTTANAAVPAEWHFVFKMPAEDVTLTPNVVPVAMDLETIQVQGVDEMKTVIYAVPPAPQGVVFTFHGTGGSADIIEKPAMQYLARLAYHRGYAVVSTEAEERTLNNGGADGKIRWDAASDVANNIDLQNIQLLSDTLSQNTAVPIDGPRFAVGMSNGGAFAVTVGATLPFAAVTSFCATGRTSAWSTTTTPTQWLMCENDSNATVSAKKDRWPDGTIDLKGRAIPTDYGVLQPAPMFAGRFARISGVGANKSNAAVAEMDAAGLLDSRGFLLQSASDIMDDYSANPGNWPALEAIENSSSFILLKGEVKHAWADHQMHDDWSARTLDFLEAQVP